ncbi:glutamine-dependent NAD(+) synthetase-like protein [Thermochaetoides thermophila DSM 1495]|uniref:Glutamine-dependent NAD(+) synthetase n=1 Tax=Chaetomium thermophilum (strain DSM 1495 / CBS 144.50 / IMI 039719) TaxID=759272 RepID=G0SGL2_CHATD|nr:glutamine-dependent NAD(+) synthetase-like protein [Thermochaetoides thermophila DSM 1495]EGS17351.1 glutamine-dependent NAD(+) synthetase-like protein [Thermochaetoides thermophila DSM 1495]
MPHLVTVATCNLNQWVLDWEGNLSRIIESIHKAKAAGARLRVGPELEICGYSSLDHFHELDVYTHSMEMLRRLLLDKSCHDIIIDVGMPVLHRNVRYNCRVICLNGKILLIRPKMWLANDGNYREMRHFTPWMRPRETELFHLPKMLAEVQGETHVLFGDAVISTPETCIGAETCDMALDGVEIFTNSSGSHLNGDIVAQGSQFSLNDVEVVTATVDLDEVRSYRAAISRGLQAATSNAKYKRIETPFELSSEDEDMDVGVAPTLPIQPRFHSVEEEIALCGGCYLWDYLRRSGAAGYLVPLSGGIDSCATAVIVYSMCRIVMQAVREGNQQVIEDVKRIARYKGEGVLPNTPQELCNQVFTTIYMGMKKQSSRETRQRARDLSDAIGSYHVNIDIDEVYEAQKKLIINALNFEPKFKVEGGTVQENLTLQCLQARIRMVTAYEFGQILPTARGRPGGGSLLILGSANVGESLRGYLTKYDCSSADINPIGSIDKADLKRFIAWAEKNFDLPCLHDFLTAVPTAELEPITENYVQSDEADMGMTYQELTIFGRLRKLNKLGPFAMFQRLVHDWSLDREKVPGDDAPFYTPREVADKVKKFFHFYAINRHKMTTLTPALHCNDYSPDDNRFDLRPFLYPPFWKSWSFKRIDMELERIERKRAAKKA